MPGRGPQTMTTIKLNLHAGPFTALPDLALATSAENAPAEPIPKNGAKF
jgi:hypothetical protein